MAKDIYQKFDDGEIILNITNDFMKAYLKIKTSKEEVNLSKQYILEFLKKNNIVYGINERYIDDIIKGNNLNKPVEIAQGLKPVSGENAFIKYYFNNNKEKKAKIDENGKIDFKELNFVESIEKGQVLAEKIPPKEGIDGINLKGEKIRANKGKDINFKLGKNVEISEDGLKVISKCKGRVEFKDGRISINTLLDIKGNVDSSTGNIRFSGDVLVYGDIKSGFFVESQGDIEVNGVIESATVKTEGDLIVKSGIQGSDKEVIFCKGNLICKYIENAKVICEGDIVTDFIVHSNIMCVGSITVNGKKGLIAGGELNVGQNITANIIGSPMGTRTYLEIGVDPKLKIKIKYFLDEKKDIEKKLKILTVTINSYKNLLKKRALSRETRDMFLKKLESYNEFSERLEFLNANIQKISSEIEDSKGGILTVKKKIYPGVKINIGKLTKYIREEISRVKFYIEDKDIVTRKL
ncbi:DUF342 domain-containing protein [Tepidibacter formicigenes]|uniref:Flagellar Assembly Protein A N-terminal region domain-containing protein n=1 Tax=Tepidibacter formicigenes DSM 15518 TaxID=1123349 RepID=A0A1M6JB96_9FIRM|nr:FapA family protein [Tepidibacter formicigenes]SHJ43988.1 hypothetical protein SAMN02744037_00057 [Tepidibacter formicigenes DSM 15518]